MEQDQEKRAGRQRKLNMAAYPLLLPQFLVRGGELAFGQTHLRESNEQERRFAARCDGRTTFREIVAGDRLVGGMAATAPYLTWLPEPLPEPAAPPLEAEAHWLVISPHPDDAELSMGGTLLKRREDTRITNLVCFSQLAHTMYTMAFVKPIETTQARRDEALLAAEYLRAEIEFLDFPEFGLREALIPPPEFVEREAEFKLAVKYRLFASLTLHKPTHVFAPAAVGNHPDHRLIFDIILEMIDEDFFPDTTFAFYEDFPYAAAYEEIDGFLSRFEHSYLDVKPWVEDISDTLEGKQVLAEMYRTQFRKEVVNSIEKVGNRTAALAHGENRPTVAERFWRAGIFAIEGAGTTWT